MRLRMSWQNLGVAEVVKSETGCTGYGDYGTESSQGHGIIEIGCVEVIDRKLQAEPTTSTSNRILRLGTV